MNFDEIIGQAKIKDFLIEAAEFNKVVHAYLFEGPAGIGKKTMAQAFVNLLLCNDMKNSKPCGECLGCQLYVNNSNPDFVMINEKGNSISVDRIREIQSSVIIKPLYSKYKVYVVCDAEKMTAQAQNCFLKTLEEPPSYAVFILTTANKSALLETVRSRVYNLAFRKNSDTEIFEILKINNKSNDLEFVVNFSDGIPGMALNLSGSDEFINLREKTLDVAIKLSKTELVEIFDVYSFFEESKEEIDLIFDFLVLFYRDILMAMKCPYDFVLINSDKKDIILRNAYNFTPLKLEKNIEEIEKTRKLLRQNANYQLAIEVLLMKLQEE